MRIDQFIERHYRHFNAAALRSAAEGFVRHLDGGGRMLVTLAGAMSTAEIGLSLAEMIRRDKVHAIACTAANLEEDVFNLVAHDDYRLIPDWRHLSPADERELERQGYNRVTDTCIPESKAFRAIEDEILALWTAADEAGERALPHRYLYRLITEGRLADRYQIDPSDSWLVAAAERDLPLFVPGWEDSTLGNIFVSHVLTGDLQGFGAIRSGLEYMAELAEWYARTTMGRPLAELDPAPEASDGPAPPGAVRPGDARATIGLFQIGGGIAGDFPICVVPMIHQDIRRRCPYWAYFCQITDATTSYGGYSGAAAAEKISWGKLDIDTPTYVVESDATIVAPLIFAYVLGW